MRKFKIIPPEDYEVLRKYLADAQGVVLIPESFLRTLPVSAQTKCQELANVGTISYDFGGEPDVYVDIIQDMDDYAYGDQIEGDKEDWDFE